MSRKLIINKWDKYTRLSIIEEVFTKNRRAFLCECDCWTIKEVLLSDLTRERVKSCWCISREILPNLWKKNTTHWKWETKEYGVWNNMKGRCNWGGKNYWWRWITYDPKWEKFEWFWEDMENWYKKWLTIERDDVNWNYEKSNCRWVIPEEQSKNKTVTIKYKNECLKDWTKRLWLNYNTVHKRIQKLWWSIEKALEIN